MHIIGLGLCALLAAILSGVAGPRLPGCTHVGPPRPPKLLRAVAEDQGGMLRVSSRHGHSHVKLGSGSHGLEVWSDERGNSRVKLGDAMRVTTDEQGRSQVRLDGLSVDSDGSD